MARSYDTTNQKEEMLKELWTNTRGDSVRVKSVTNTVSGDVSVDIRRYYTDDNDEVKPTSKGIRLNTELIPDLIEVLASLLEYNEVEEVKEKLDDILDRMESDELDEADTPAE